MYLNVDFPWNVKSLADMMEFSNGDIEEINALIPDFVKFVIPMEKLNEKQD